MFLQLQNAIYLIKKVLLVVKLSKALVIFKVVVRAGDKALVSADLENAAPTGVYWRISIRSGVAAKHHIYVGARVIDADLRGNVTVVLLNHGSEDVCIQTGERISQLVRAVSRMPNGAQRTWFLFARP